ncbi:hypothetical protein QBC40DRAFT_316489 [Triangularia verruculosa]|uniref:Uncharacterized protein n=1 Tax=Triangularia verruculosa TaxID=2587418 RepID=A0AAN7AQI0_9PEZI|nr:hypothetical protein QBC40DRAFT_316489 [Triangularia verruculosa]
MGRCDGSVTTAYCLWAIQAANRTGGGGGLREEMLKVHVIVPAVTVCGLMVLGMGFGMGLWVLRRRYVMEELGCGVVAEGGKGGKGMGKGKGKGRWWEDAPGGSGSDGTQVEVRLPQQQQQQQSQERTGLMGGRDKELPPPPLQIRRVGERGLVVRREESEMGMEGMDLLRGREGDDGVGCWANFGPPPPWKGSDSGGFLSLPLPSPAPAPSPSPLLPPLGQISQEPATKPPLPPPPRPWTGEQKRYTYPNPNQQLQQQGQHHFQPPPPPRSITRDLTTRFVSQPDNAKSRVYRQPRSAGTCLVPRCSQPEMRQLDRARMTFGTVDPAAVSKREGPGLGLGLGLGIVERKGLEGQELEKGRGKGKERERLVRSRRFSVSLNF